MTDDEISELAECLWDACAEAERNGKHIGDRRGLAPPLPLCPLEALTGDYNLPNNAKLLRLSWREISAFGHGFDYGDFGSGSMFDLGRRFREQALSGEGFK